MFDVRAGGHGEAAHACVQDDPKKNGLRSGPALPLGLPLGSVLPALPFGLPPLTRHFHLGNHNLV